MSRISRILFLAAGLVVASVSSAFADQLPPTGAILDLDGQPIFTTFQQYSVNFVANLANTAITFAFRNDPAYLYFENASVVDLTNASANLLVNGDFSADPGDIGSNTPFGWSYENIYGAGASGVVSSGCGGPQASGICWDDGAVGAYDAISQSILTAPGHIYQISFHLAADGSQANYSRITSINGDGIDALVYAQAGLPDAAGTVPEPGAFVLVAAGGILLGLRRHLQSKRG